MEAHLTSQPEPPASPEKLPPYPAPWMWCWIGITAATWIVALLLAHHAQSFMGTASPTCAPAAGWQSYGTAAGWVAGAAALSSVVGIFVARGWRWWFAALTVAAPFLFIWLVALVGIAPEPPSCPGPFS